GFAGAAAVGGARVAELLLDPRDSEYGNSDQPGGEEQTEADPQVLGIAIAAAIAAATAVGGGRFGRLELWSGGQWVTLRHGVGIAGRRRRVAGRHGIGVGGVHRGEEGMRCRLRRERKFLFER